MKAEKSRPADETGRPQAHHATTLPSHIPATAEAEHPPNAGVMNGTANDILALIQRERLAFYVWLHGYEAGLIGGRADQRLEDQEIAEMAARIAVAQVENQTDVRATVRHAAQFIDVHLAREKTRLANLSRPDSRRFTWDSDTSLGPHSPRGGTP